MTDTADHNAADMSDEQPVSRGIIPPIPGWQIWLPYVVLVLAVFHAYINVYNNHFLFDDDLIIIMNEHLRHFDLKTFLTTSTTSGAHIAGGFYRPMQMMLYYVTYQLFGESTFAFHLQNIILHAINVCLMYRIGRKMGFHSTACFWSSLIWAVHPIHTEAVAYMSATADPMFAMFSMICIVNVLPDFSPRKIWLMTPVFILALLSKETAAVVPAVMMVTMFVKSEHPWRIKQYLRTWPLWVIAAAFLAWRMTNIDFDGPRRYALLYNRPEYHNLFLYGQNYSYRIYTFLATLPAYLKMLVWPVGLHMERNFAVYNEFWIAGTIGGMLMVIAALVFMVECRGPRGKPLTWGLLWFAAVHAPDTGLFVVGNSLLLEHWMYLPTVGLFLGIGESIQDLLSRTRSRIPKIAVIAACVVATTLLTFRTLDQNTVWQDGITFYQNIFKHGELSARAHNNLALAYMNYNQVDKAIEEFNKAIAMTDSYAETHHNLGLAYLRLANDSKVDEQEHIRLAILNLQKALEIDPHFYRSAMALAEVYRITGDKEKSQYYQNMVNQVSHP